MNSDALGQCLLQLARQTIAQTLADEPATPADLPPACRFPELQQPAATFVTLRLHEQLRGCIGSLEAQRNLLDDVRHNAQAAAFRDPRFPALSAAELAQLHIEVSLLTTPIPLHFNSEADALAQLRPGVDGVILRCGNGMQRATFLPQVWADLPQPAQFMAQLKRKAGLAMDDWPADIQLSRYEVKKWTEAQTDSP